MQALYVPQEAQRQYFSFYFTGTSRDRVIKHSAGIVRAKPEIYATNTRVQNKKKKTPTQTKSISNSFLQQLQHSRTTIFCHSDLLLQRNNIFYPPYVILPLGIFPYSKWYFKDRVKATL